MRQHEFPIYKEISTEKEMKLKYLGYCSKCNKDMPHRLDGGSLFETRYRCMKCKTINVAKYQKPNQN